ncbi:MAG: hypothetical protein GF383_13865 [Candidatus Lokiarchaeota archaeon]|nr:hypothetical protein [Candidatus Lokiarchaeota archaeon]MBD3342391.1 hypothetical protein [Candidatus Lokiarchaeota archaeon]
MTEYQDELYFAVKIVKEAINITEWFQKRGFRIYTKKDKSKVTTADFASQLYLNSMLRNEFEDDEVLAEEKELKLLDKKAKKSISRCFDDLGISQLKDYEETFIYCGKSSTRKWTVDPIDGTPGYQKSLSYAIGLGLMNKNEFEIAVIGIPNYKSQSHVIFIAEKTQGAKASYGGNNFEKIKVSNKSDLSKASLCQSLHYDLPWVSQFADDVNIDKSNRIKLDSMAKFCLIADGSYDLYIKPIMGYEAPSWDFGPGDLLVREAGGMVTDLDEELLQYEGEKCILRAPGIITTNKYLHEEVAHIIRDKYFSIHVE